MQKCIHELNNECEIGLNVSCETCDKYELPIEAKNASLFKMEEMKCLKKQ